MKKCKIYYDSSQSAKLFTEELTTRKEAFEAVPVKDLVGNMFHRENCNMVGFIFHSEHGRIPQDMYAMFNRIIMPKSNYVFIIVSGGDREMKALKTACSIMRSRGYHVAQAYTELILERVPGTWEEQLDAIVCSIENKEKDVIGKETLEEVSKQALKKDIRKYIKNFIKRESK